MGEVKYLVLCSAYNNHSEVEQFVDSVFALSTGANTAVVCVDNGEPPPSDSDRLTRKYPGRFLYLKAEQNLGYFGGARAALDFYVDLSGTIPEWVIVANTDIEFPQHDIFARLTRRIYSPTCRVVGPTIISKRDGRDQNPFMTARPSRLRMYLLKLIALSYATLLLYQIGSILQRKVRRQLKINRRENSHSGPVSVYAVHGAFMIFHSAYFRHGGTLRPPSFMFGEEIFVAEVVRGTDGVIQYDPHLEVIHREHATTGVRRIALKSRQSARYIKESRRALWSNYFSLHQRVPRSN